MDDEGAKKVVVAIERLSNRTAKLDATCVEAAAIANEARRAAMDAADATDPKRTANTFAFPIVTEVKPGNDNRIQGPGYNTEARA